MLWLSLCWTSVPCQSCLPLVVSGSTQLCCQWVRQVLFCFSDSPHLRSPLGTIIWWVFSKCAENMGRDLHCRRACRRASRAPGVLITLAEGGTGSTAVKDRLLPLEIVRPACRGCGAIRLHCKPILNSALQTPRCFSMCTCWVSTLLPTTASPGLGSP